MPIVLLGNLPFLEWENTSVEANVALGRFLTAWAQIETVCGHLFQRLSGIDFERSLIVFENMETHKQIVSIQDLAKTHSDASLTEKIVLAMEEMQKLSVIRNKIVHSQWGLYDEGPARFWRSLTVSHLNEIMRNVDSKRRKDNVFTVNDMVLKTAEEILIRDRLLAAVMHLDEVRISTLFEENTRRRLEALRRRRPG